MSSRRVAPWVLLLASVPGCSFDRGADAGFWFEPIAYDSARLGGPLSHEDLHAIVSSARTELTTAFAGLRINVTDDREAPYKVWVVQELWDPRLKRRSAVAGASRAISGFGGAGNVNFELLAENALSYAPAEAPRPDLIAAIGRGIGRAAAHEFAHQFLPTASFHDSRNIRSYEYPAASRREQYWGPMEWDAAWPLLVNRLGTTE